MANEAAQVTVDTQGSDFNTLLAAYTGSTLSALTPVASNDDVNGSIDRTSRITFNSVVGAAYYIAVDGFNGAGGSVSLHLNQAAVAPENNFANAITLVGNLATASGTNIGATKESGEPNHGGNPAANPSGINGTLPGREQSASIRRGATSTRCWRCIRATACQR